MSSLDDYPVVIDLPVLWGDQDLFGHVNNTIHLKWFESSRVRYWDDSGMRTIMEPRNWGPILAKLSCDYLKQIKYPDNVRCGARVSKLGRTSMTLEHALFSSNNQAIAATGISVIVLFDYTRQRPQRIEPELQEMIQSFEGRSFEN